jgi:site-specific DNA-methyltransferase (adenine-specific)
MSLLIRGDALEVLRAMPGESVDEIATSPPYFRQRDYGMPGQIGRERTVRQYLERLWAVFDEAFRVLRPEGNCFVNLGDKYIGKRRMLIPERFAIGLEERGCILRNYIVWHKTNPKPESIRSRFANDWEAVFFFVKSESHYFSIQHEEYAESSVKRCISFVKNEETFDPNRHKHDPANARQAATRITERVAKNLCIPGQTPNGMHVERSLGRGRDVYDVRGRRMRSVWSLPVGRYPGAHFATWPPELVRRIILAGCRPGGVVLDPFVGSGTTVVVAEELGCTGIGIDISEEFLAIARQMVLEARAKRAKAGEKGRQA